MTNLLVEVDGACLSDILMDKRDGDCMIWIMENFVSRDVVLSKTHFPS